MIGSGDFRYIVDESWAKFPAMGDAGEAVGVACDASDRVFVLLRGPRPILAFDPDGTPQGSLDQVEFTRPHGITIRQDGTIFGCDDFGHCVRIYHSDGSLRQILGNPGVPSDTGATSIDYRTIQRSGPPFNYPCNLAIGPTGDWFVADGYGNARVHRFTPEGRLVASWGEPGTGPGQFQIAHGIGVDGDGIVYVADRENSRIQRFTSEGVYLDSWTDVARPCHIVFDREGLMYVAELGFHAGRWPGTGSHRPGETGGRVSIFDPCGRLLARWGGGARPCDPGDFFAPHGIAVDSRGDLYVSEVALAGGARAGLVPGSCHTLQKFIRQR